MRWLDWLILALLAGITGYIGLRMQGALNYDWRWELIPDYMLRYREDRQEWFANLLLGGLFATIRISIYASILALIIGTILGVARCSENLTTRLLARTYLELLRNIPPVIIIFVFFFFLSQQLIDALNLNSWSRGIARSDNSHIWEFFFGDCAAFRR